MLTNKKILCLKNHMKIFLCDFSCDFSSQMHQLFLHLHKPGTFMDASLWYGTRGILSRKLAQDPDCSTAQFNYRVSYDIGHPDIWLSPRPFIKLTQKISRCPVHVYKGPGTQPNFPGVQCRGTPCSSCHSIVHLTVPTKIRPSQI